MALLYVPSVVTVIEPYDILILLYKPYYTHTHNMLQNRSRDYIGFENAQLRLNELYLTRVFLLLSLLHW